MTRNIIRIVTLSTLAACSTGSENMDSALDAAMDASQTEIGARVAGPNGPGPQPRMVRADLQNMGDEDLWMVIAAASGQGEAAAMAMADALDADARYAGVTAPPGCIEAEYSDGGWVRYSAAGCTGLETGATWEGAVDMRNVVDMGMETYEQAHSLRDAESADPHSRPPAELKFQGMYMAADADELVVQGAMTIAQVPEGLRQKAKLAITSNDRQMNIDSSIQCASDGEGTEACWHTAPAKIRIPGLGQVRASGGWGLDQGEPAGRLEIHGKQKMVVDMNVPEAGCMTVTVDEQDSQELCG